MRHCRLAAFCALLTSLILPLMSGCGGGGSAISSRSDGKIAIAAQTIDLVNDAGDAASRTLSIASITVSPGQEFALLVTASDTTGLAGMALKLEFDKSVLACAAVSPGNWVAPAAQVAKNVSTAGGVAMIAVASTTVANASGGPLATFQLRAVSGAAPQNAS